VSERAIGTDQDKKFVMVVGADNKAEYREVTLGAPVNGLRVVSKGLKPATAWSSTACSTCAPGRWCSRSGDHGRQGRPQATTDASRCRLRAHPRPPENP
jgi:hypothetical protein